MSLLPKEKNENSEPISFTIEPGVKADFYALCNSLDTDYSKRIRLLIKKDLQENRALIKNPQSNYLKQS